MDTPYGLKDHVSQRAVRTRSWTSGFGCGALASNSTRRHSARTRSDEKVLPNLTAEDLKEMGVSIVGHRRMLLDAIAAAAQRWERESAACRSFRRQSPKPAQDTRRAPPSHSDVLGPRRFDSTLGAHGP